MKKNASLSLTAVVAVLSVCSASAQTPTSYDTASVTVNRLQLALVPDSVYFQANIAVGNCNAGDWLLWRGGALFASSTNESLRFTNVKSTANALSVAKVSGQLLWLRTNPKTSGAYCEITDFHVQ
jgi:hypothetical protein